jgi:hypothetical protein
MNLVGGTNRFNSSITKEATGDAFRMTACMSPPHFQIWISKRQERVEGEKGVGRGGEGKGATSVLAVTRLNGFTTAVNGSGRGPEQGRKRGREVRWDQGRGPRGIMVQAG